MRGKYMTQLMTPAEQSAQDKAANAVRNARQATARIAQREAEMAALAGLRAKVAAAMPLNNDSRYSLRAVTRPRAEDLGMAPSVAGGWVAVGLPSVRVGWDYLLVAKLPLSMDYGQPLAVTEVTASWASELGAAFTDERNGLAQAMIAKIESL